MNTLDHYSYRESAIPLFRLLYRLRKKLRLVGLGILALFTVFVVAKYYISSVIVFLIFVICVLSVQHLRFMPWLGAIDLNLVLTVYTSIQYGLPAGFFVGNASIVGLILAGDIDNTLIYDFVASYIVAFSASFFALGLFTPVATTLAIIYGIGYCIYHYYMGTLEMTNISWITTNTIWIFFLLYKLLPLLG